MRLGIFVTTFALILFILTTLYSCSDNYIATAEFDVDAKGIDFDDQYADASIVFKIKDQIVIAFLDDLDRAQYSYVKEHKENVKFHVKLTVRKGSWCGCDGVHMTFYLFGKEIQTVERIMDFDIFQHSIASKIPLKVETGSSSSNISQVSPLK
jgi:hypothetical protein